MEISRGGYIVDCNANTLPEFASKINLDTSFLSSLYIYNFTHWTFEIFVGDIQVLLFFGMKVLNFTALSRRRVSTSNKVKQNHQSYSSYLWNFVVIFSPFIKEASSWASG